MEARRGTPARSSVRHGRPLIRDPSRPATVPPPSLPRPPMPPPRSIDSCALFHGRHAFSLWPVLCSGEPPALACAALLANASRLPRRGPALQRSRRGLAVLAATHCRLCLPVSLMIWVSMFPICELEACACTSPWSSFLMDGRRSLPLHNLQPSVPDPAA